MTRSVRRRHTEGDPHWLEWVTGVICGFIVLAMIGWIAREAWYYSGAPPELSAQILDVVPAGENYRVAIEVRNDGTSTAASVSVRGELRRRGDAVLLEASDVILDYVPASSTATGALFFQNDPEGGELSVRPMGYATP